MTPAHPTLLVNLEPGRSNTGLLQVASNLARRLDAAVIGVASRQPMQLDISGTCYISPELVDEERDETDRGISGAEAEFRAVFGGADPEWRSSVTFAAPCDYIVDQARHADLVLTGMASHGVTDPTRATPGEVVMRCGRPVIVVPREPATPSLDRVMLAWRDTREARRASLDCLPLLLRATHVTIVELAASDDMAAARERLTDVARWLAGHGVQAETIAAATSADDAAQIETLARNGAADLVVAGAFGHSRIREWAFGGVTRTLLHHADRCALLSH